MVMTAAILSGRGGSVKHRRLVLTRKTWELPFHGYADTPKVPEIDGLNRVPLVIRSPFHDSPNIDKIWIKDPAPRLTLWFKNVLKINLWALLRQNQGGLKMQDNYWSKFAGRRIGRRQALAATGSVAAAAAFLAACGGDDDSGGGGTTGGSTGGSTGGGATPSGGGATPSGGVAVPLQAAF